MSLRDIPFFRDMVRLPRHDITDEPPLSTEPTRELEDLRKTSLNLLMAFLAVHAISASHALCATTLALLVYTINLHVAMNTRFLQGCPTLSRFLHTIPILGIFYMAVFQLVIVVQSPAIVAGVLLACALPPLTVALHFARRYTEMTSMPFPVQMRDVTPALPSPAEQNGVSS